MHHSVMNRFGRSLPTAPAFQRPISLPSRRPSLGAGFPEMVEQLRTKGPVLSVQVGIPKALADQMVAQGQTPPPPEEILALVDTGASITAINTATAERLGLQATGAINVGGATGVSQMPLYAAMLRISEPFIEWDPMTISGSNLGHAPFEMLIGRNVLCNMTLAYDGKQGRFSLIL